MVFTSWSTIKTARVIAGVGPPSNLTRCAKAAKPLTLLPSGMRMGEYQGSVHIFFIPRLESISEGKLPSNFREKMDNRDDAKPGITEPAGSALQPNTLRRSVPRAV